MRKLLYLALIWLVSSSFTIHLMGDSTLAEKDLPKAGEERGWGMMFPNFLDDGVQVVNYAQNGRSTKSFIDLGLWKQVQEAVRPGDYVFIQFGHNDAKESDPARYAPAWGAYQKNLRLFVDGVRKKGGIPVLLTPVARRWFKDGVLDRNCHTDYPAAMKAVAQEKGVALLDITTATLDWLEGLGDEASKSYFMVSTGKDDNTHTVARGARKVETMFPEPKSPYAVTKLDGEYYGALFTRERGLPCACLRYFNVFGPRQDPKGAYAAAVPIFITRALNDEDITIYGDGEQTRDFIFVKDVVAANLHFAQSEATGVYNIARGGRITINDLAETIVRLTESKSKIVHLPDRPGDVKHSMACVDKAAQAGYKAGHTFDEGLAATIEFYRGRIVRK